METLSCAMLWILNPHLSLTNTSPNLFCFPSPFLSQGRGQPYWWEQRLGSGRGVAIISQSPSARRADLLAPLSCLTWPKTGSNLRQQAWAPTKVSKGVLIWKPLGPLRTIQLCLMCNHLPVLFFCNYSLFRKQWRALCGGLTLILVSSALICQDKLRDERR